MNIGEDYSLYFIYDATGPMGLRVTNGTASTTYYYAKNLQGDIVAILNKAGKAVVEYTYGAWGNIVSIEGDYKNGLGLRNPLLYRGYVYDRETKLYYLQSRYYDPVMGRFLNADAYASTGQGILGNNMFAYCQNNPVVFCDSEGNRPINALSVAEETKEDRQRSFAYMNKDRSTRSNNTNRTVSTGVSGSASAGPWAWNLQGFITLDSYGNIALQVAWSGGISTHVADSGFTVACTPFVMITNAPSYRELEGRGAAIGGTLPANYTIVVDYNMMLDKSGQEVLYHGVSVGAGLGAGTPEVHVMWGGETYTIGSMSAVDYFNTVNYLSTLW